MKWYPCFLFKNPENFNTAAKLRCPQASADDSNPGLHELVKCFVVGLMTNTAVVLDTSNGFGVPWSIWNQVFLPMSPDVGPTDENARPLSTWQRNSSGKTGMFSRRAFFFFHFSQGRCLKKPRFQIRGKSNKGTLSDYRLPFMRPNIQGVRHRSGCTPFTNPPQCRIPFPDGP